MYILLDANVTAGYYLPHTLDYVKAADRIEILFNSIRSKGSDHFLYLPNLCVAEVFSTFAKHSYGKWNQQVKKKSGQIDSRVYESICNQFEKDIHNGKLIYHYELSRYHVLAIDLVAPADHYFKMDRKKKWVNPAGTFDQLIVAMGVHLAHIHGQTNVCIVTTDNRLVNLVKKCRADIPDETVKSLKLNKAKEIAGKKFSKELFPRALHLGRCSDKELKEVFGNWPLLVKRHSRAKRYVP